MAMPQQTTRQTSAAAFAPAAADHKMCDLLFGIPALSAKIVLEIHEYLLSTHLVCFSRHGVLDIVNVRCLYIDAHARV